MTDQTQRHEIATVKAEIGSNILSRFSNDPIDAEPIPTASGDIKNLKQEAAEIRAAGQEAVDQAVADVIVDLTGAVASAQSSADQAAAVINPFPTVGDGISGTSGSGATSRFFSVPGAGETLTDLYRNDSGVAMKIGSVMPWALGALPINRGKAFPLKQMNRAGVTSTANSVINRVVLGVKVIGDAQYIDGKYFRIAYLQNEANVSGNVAQGIILEEFDAATYQATGTATVIHTIGNAPGSYSRSGGVQTFTIVPEQRSNLLFIITIDADSLPTAGTPINMQTSEQSGYSWIIEQSCYESVRGMGNSLAINRGRVYPLRKMIRNAITSAEPTAFSKAILNICIVGARAGKYYRLAYYVNGSTAVRGAKADGWRIEEVDQANYASAANPVTSVIDITDVTTPTITWGGIQSVVLSSSVINDLRVLISLDIAELLAYGTAIQANGSAQAGYSYIIDPSRYIPAKSESASSISINSGQLVPFRSMSRGGVVSTPNALQTNVILNARVINAKRGKFYGLRYFQNGNDAVVPAADGWIIEEVDIVGYDASVIVAGSTITALADPQPAIDRMLGIQTVLLNTKSDVRIEVTLDASKLQAYGTQYGMNAVGQTGYSHVIDPACYESAVASSGGGSPKITYLVDSLGRTTISWSDGVGTRSYVFGPNGNNNLPNFVQVLRNGGVISSFGTDWLPPITFETAENGDGRTPLEFTGGNHLIDGLQTAVNLSFVIEADGVPLKIGDSGTIDRLTFRVLNKLMANNTVSLGRYALLQSLQVDFAPGAANVHCEVLALEDLQIYVDYGCQMVTDGANDTLFYLGGQFPAPIPFDNTKNSGLAAEHRGAWAVLTAGSAGQLMAWMDRSYGIADGSEVYSGYGMIVGGSGSAKQYTTAIHRFLVRGSPNYMQLNAGKTYKWRGGYSWGPVDVKAGLVASTRYLDGDRIRRADAVSALAVLNP